MFNDTKYTKWYKDICKNTYDGYTECHHIIPKCMGGTDDLDNLVNLSPKAHFIAHWLLTKMIDNSQEKAKMVYAFNFMLKKPKDHKDKRHYPCSRVYDTARRLMKEHNPSKSKEVRRKISESRKRNWQNPTQAMIDGIEKMRQSKMGNTPWNKGKTGLQSVGNETRKLMSKQRTGRKWYNDGENEYFIKQEDAMKHYNKGRLKRG